MEYFTARFWPLLTTASTPCTPPVAMAWRHRPVFLATCVVAETHRFLQDGRNDRHSVVARRGECLSAVRRELTHWSMDTGKVALQMLMMSVLILYFNDGLLEKFALGQAPAQDHGGGLKAILEQLGGIDALIDTSCPESLRMLISEYMSADLTSALLRGEKPSFTAEDWRKIEQGPIWWTRDPGRQSSLGNVFQQLAQLAFYKEAIGTGAEILTIEKIRDLESSLNPSFASVSIDDFVSHGVVNSEQLESARSQEAIEAQGLVRAFQHAGLIYLYRAICSLNTYHALVQQHVAACLETVAAMDKDSKVLYCMTFPLFVAGAHAHSPRHRQCAASLVSVIHSKVKFASVDAMGQHLRKVWKLDRNGMSWIALFENLGSNMIIL